jgi:hypothetical protein
LDVAAANDLLNSLQVVTRAVIQSSWRADEREGAEIRGGPRSDCEIANA